MTLCSDGHYEICYEDKFKKCPLCEKISDDRAVAADYEQHIKDLECEIKRLHSELNLKGGHENE